MTAASESRVRYVIAGVVIAALIAVGYIAAPGMPKVDLTGVRVGILLVEQYEYSEAKTPLDYFSSCGASVRIIGLERGTIMPYNEGEPGIVADTVASDVRPEDLDCLVIPGSWVQDKQCDDPDTLALVEGVGQAGGVIGASCHGPMVLAAANLLNGRTVTGYPEIRTMLVEAGATYRPVANVADGNIITAMGPSNMEAYLRSLVSLLKR